MAASKRASSVEALPRLWAPWRSAFLSGPKPRRCIFCAAGRSTQDRRHHVIARHDRVFALLNRYPYNNGHLMVAPYRHVGSLTALTEGEWLGLLALSRRFTRVLSRAMHPQGFNVGFNLGRAGGAGLPGHLHLHLVPRWNGDTNFMPVLADTKVISQSLDELYRLLRFNATRRSR